MDSGDDRATPRAALLAAVAAGDVGRARELFRRHPELRASLNDPAPELPFGVTPLLPVVQLGNPEMIDLFLGAGADINARSHWWSGGFGVLDSCAPELAPFLIERGAVVDAHAASRLGMLDRLRALVAEDPGVVHARGGDGQTPLHFAANVEVARLLLDHGADPDALDLDHESTPAQWMLSDRHEVARFLVERGCRTDLLMVTALGDLERVRRHLDADPASIRVSVNERNFPMRDPRAGGTIYIWALGMNRTPHLVARRFGHPEVLRLLLERSPAELRLTMAAATADRATVEAMLAEDPDLIHTLAEEDRRRLADAAEDEDPEAVDVMLAAGWPVEARGRHGGTALHWAAWHGDVEMVRALVKRGAPLEVRDGDFDASPLGWAMHASRHGWHPDRGNYAGAVEALLAAGARPPGPTDDREASEPVREALRRHGAKP